MDNNLNNLKVATLTLGCKVNQYETDAMIGLLKNAGCEIVDFQAHADVYIINTCSVTNMADRKSRQMLHRAKKENPEAIVVAAGCYVQTDKDRVMEDYAVDIILGNNVKKNIVEALIEYFESKKTCREHFLDIGQTKEYEEMKLQETNETTRAYVKVQDGCNQFCSYCIIPYARGRVRSRVLEDVMLEVQNLAQNGYKEIVLTGIHLSSYGVDQNDKKESMLGNLIEEVSTVNGIERVRLGSLEPRIITDDFLSGLTNNTKFCPHFHLSLQSACNATLKRMNRKYTIEEYMEKCELIRKYFDMPAITTDVIVGFPGETDKEFGVTVKNLETLNLYEMHIFKFSPRRGTVAEKMTDQVPEPVKSERSDVLLAMSKKHQKNYEDTFVGKEISVLVEEEITIEGKRYVVGHTPNYMRVFFEGTPKMLNAIVKVLYQGAEVPAIVI